MQRITKNQDKYEVIRTWVYLLIIIDIYKTCIIKTSEKLIIDYVHDTIDNWTLPKTQRSLLHKCFTYITCITSVNRMYYTCVTSVIYVLHTLTQHLIQRLLATVIMSVTWSLVHCSVRSMYNYRIEYNCLGGGFHWLANIPSLITYKNK